MSARLVDFDPTWIDYGERRRVGVRFRCLKHHCRGYLWIFFSNPLDGGPPVEGDAFSLMLEIAEQSGDREKFKYDRGCGRNRWHREGDTFETLTMTPSVDAHRCGHATLTNGVFVYS